ncbi:YCF48-related protein [Rubripirellula reticaptiva]|uniref:Ycf48-like protein n=1 Tax=Rubripirellula reticaptiva TaxID=2528013 RepID=A0A5C6FCG3_9BACT|nr:hypothetical protein [Rubripirellula reticaptiva]TWU57786.1 Ycf48-like protein [Rubripirellula reticaptiva]
MKNMTLGNQSCATHSFFCVLVAVGLLNLATVTKAKADLPESPPGYAETETLRADATLRSIAFQDASHGIAVGDRGMIVTTDDGGKSWIPRSSGIGCRIDDVVWTGPGRAVAVGGAYDAITRISRAVVLVTNDNGQRWLRGDDRELPRLKSVTVNEDGTLTADGDWSHPSLTRQFESRNAGRTWTGVGDPELMRPTPPQRPTGSSEFLAWAQATSTAVAIRDACQVGSSSVCAVGDHGTILISEDNGTTWTTRRGKDRRTAVLMIARTAESVAWSILGSESLESRHRTSVLIDDLGANNNDDADPIDLANQFSVTLGASGADRFRTVGEDPNEAALRWIAVMRPAVVLIDETLSTDTKQAFFQAATAAGVQRVAHYSTTLSQSTTLHSGALLPKTGVLASDLASDAMHLVAPEHTDIDSLSLTFVYDADPSHRTGESTASGLSLHSGRMLSPRSSPASRRQLQIIQARMKQSHRITQLLDTQGSREPFEKSLASVLDQTAKEDQFRLAWSILAKTKTTESASIQTHKAVLDEISRRFADQSAGKWAKLRLQSINHSTEWRRLNSILQASNVSLASATVPATRSVAVSPFQSGPQQNNAPENYFTDSTFLDPSMPGQVQQVSAIAPVVVPRPDLIEYTGATRAKAAAEVDLTWEFHPSVLLGMEASRRRGDDSSLQAITSSHSPNASHDMSEQPASLRQLSESRGNPWAGLLRSRGSQVIHAHHTPKPPHLDGVLDDACWQLNQASTDTPLRMSYDDDYIYAAFVCPSSSINRDDFDRDRATPRDNDLSKTDRMRICLDVDKDLFTSMQFQSSVARRTHDSIDGNAAWQPTWYLDVKEAKGLDGNSTTTFEIAILRRDIIDLPIQADSPWGETSWFVSAMILPGKSQSSTPTMPNPSDWMRVVFK